MTITQAIAVWELRAASETASRWQLWAGAMRIGRDHIASAIYTIVFAYAGAALMTLLVIQLYDRPVLDLVGTEQIAEEGVRPLASGIGLVLAVPLTSPSPPSPSRDPTTSGRTPDPAAGCRTGGAPRPATSGETPFTTGCGRRLDTPRSRCGEPARGVDGSGREPIGTRRIVSFADPSGAS